MSHQYDEYMQDRFDLYGTEYRIVAPENAEELVHALEVKSALETHINGLIHDEDSSEYESLLQEQTDNIQEYIDSLGEFDSTILASNIAFLCKKNGVRIGELEEMLGISTGYISRTIKENSKKKMSVDIVWKIALLFGTDIKTLTETQMWVSHTNTDLLEKFLNRLYQDTKDNFFAWEYDGGLMTVLNDRYKQMGLVTEDADETAVYHPNHLNQGYKWLLAKDIVYLESFEEKKDLVIVPYKNDGNGEFGGYDFIFVWQDEGLWCWEKVFYTSDDPFKSLQNGAEKLYDLIESAEYDAKLSPKVHQIITSYVKGGRPE
ncbi:helix-turn-helix domain-containing protein [Aminipila sp.]|uniref:helix-turn-helix domain-containing protein n=1 Tax=Aminipila sp. TaxID=2060095 RepID=UPI00289C6DB2|nr:helix-turn-helix transcriptional regulator [Aminipila sp.]